ncbi:hypothetical protein ACM78Z_27235 [Pseudomonas aeruginosa]
MTRSGNRSNTWKRSRSSILREAQRFSGVIGVDYGYLYKKGERTRDVGVRFHVQSKRPLQEITAGQVLPTSLNGLPCDVLQASYSLCASPLASCDPIQPGVSVGNLNQFSTGTLGLLVTDKLTGRPAILSNWHVLCGSTQANPGDVLIQPGAQHMGTRPPRPIARLERWLPLATGFDAAIGLLDPGVNWKQELFGTLIVIKGIVNPKHGMKLAKFGSMSGLTRCVVDGVDGMYTIDYSSCGDVARSMGGIMLRSDPQFQTPEISLEGDSGAVWTDEQGRAVALLFAGEDGRGPTAEYALAHPIERIFDLLQIEPLSAYG